MAHIKSSELCDRCEHGIEKCMDRWDENGGNCEGCVMSCEIGCMCDEIADGIPCEFFKERNDGKV